MKFKGFNVHLEFDSYVNSENTAIQLISEDGEVICMATVNGNLTMPDNIVGIKEWGENEGITQFLIKNRIINKDPIDKELTGFVTIYYYQLTKYGESLMNQQRFDGDSD